MAIERSPCSDEKADSDESDVEFEKPLVVAISGKSFGPAKLLPIQEIHAPVAPDLTQTSSLTKEHSEVGRVKWKVYTSYIKAASPFGFALFLVLMIASQAFSIGANVTLMKWGDAGAAANVGRYIAIYGICVALSSAASALSSLFLWVLCTLRSARELHDGMLLAVMHAPLSFFETTPIGR